MVVEVVGVIKGLYTKETLDGLLLKATDEMLRQVFKENGTKVIYAFLGNNSHLKREELAEKPEVFSAGLKRLLSSGAPVIEDLILKSLYSKLESQFEEREGYEFADYVEELRKRLKDQGG